MQEGHKLTSTKTVLVGLNSVSDWLLGLGGIFLVAFRGTTTFMGEV